MMAGILLSAGRSKRFGSQKLLIPFAEGLTLFEHTLRTHLSADISPLILVVSREIFARFFPQDGHVPSRYQIERSPAAPWTILKTPWGTARLVINETPEEGMSSSLKRGLQGLRDPEKEKGVLISLSDMPKITPQIIHSLIHTYRHQSADLVAPVFQGKIGHPVIFREPFYRQAISEIHGDKGLRDIIRSNTGNIVFVPWENDAVITDVDTIEDLNRIFQKGVFLNGN